MHPPSNLTTSEADAWRAGYAAGAGAVGEAVMRAVLLRAPMAGRLSMIDEHRLVYPREQPGDREPTGLDGRGA